jgi:hypothetical protein
MVMGMKNSSASMIWIRYCGSSGYAPLSLYVQQAPRSVVI